MIRYENGTVTGGYRIIADHLGSPRLVVDANSGAVALRRTYDAFGRVLDSEGSLALVFGYAGGLYDPLTGLVRFGARDYDAETGRWTAKDPIGFAGGDPGLYGYALGDPVNFVDPEGEVAWLAVAAGVYIGFRAIFEGYTEYSRPDSTWKTIIAETTKGALLGTFTVLGFRYGRGTGTMLLALDALVTTSDIARGEDKQGEQNGNTYCNP